MSGKPQKIIPVRTVGKPDIELAAELFAPLILKIHKRNQAKGMRLAQQQAQGAKVLAAHT